MGQSAYTPSILPVHPALNGASHCVALPCLHKSDGVEHRQQLRILFVRMRASAELPRRARAERVHFS